MLAPAVFWYVHAHQLYLEDGNTFGIIGGGFLKFGTRETLTDLSIYKHTAIRIAVYLLTPLGTLFFIYGCYLAVQRRLTFVLVWLAAVTVHAFVAFGGLHTRDTSATS